MRKRFIVIALLLLRFAPICAQASQKSVGGQSGPWLSAQNLSLGSGLQFMPVTPCRVVDTRNPDGPFGGPEMSAGSTREFDIPQSACGIPSSSVAYSLNVTVVPDGMLGYLSMWPTGQTQPLVSTLNSDGRVKANAAVTPAGANGGVDVYVTNTTHVILDIDGYFVPAGTASALAFYPLTPCRVVDTRNLAGTLGGPSIAKESSRNFPIQSSGCNIPSTATAYSLNVTVVPKGPLGYLTIWPTGAMQPAVSTLNSYNGEVVANAAIVPAGTSGQVSVYVSDASDVVMDVNGYFAPPGTGGLSLYTASPCRVLDTRTGAGPFSGVLVVDVKGNNCAPPTTAEAYVLNATVVPQHPLGYCTFWPHGAIQPVVSTFNADDGAITSNMVIVPTYDGKIDVYCTDPTELILDISSFFAPVGSVAYQLFGADFSPYETRQDPNLGSQISVDQMTKHIAAIAPYVKNLRTFGVTDGLENFGCLAHEFSLGAYVGAWIDTDLDVNEASVQELITLAQSGCVDVAIIGSEVLLRGDVTSDQLNAYISEFRAAVPNVPVATADTYGELLAYPSVVANSDLIFANYYPFWEGANISLAIADLNAEDMQLQKAYPGKEVIVSETGWPSGGNPNGNAVPSLSNAAYYFLDFESWAQANKRKTFYFEVNDEDWKANYGEGTVGPTWGIFDDDGKMKYGQNVFAGATVPDNWSCNTPVGGTGTPSIALTSVPPIGSSNLLQGQELHEPPSSFYVAVYIYVNGGWWTKPTFAQPMTTIQCDGTWSAQIVTGGDDQDATQIAAFLIPDSYGSPPQMSGQASLPPELSQNAAATAIVGRQ